MRTLISGFLQQKSDRQPFFDYVASEAEKMTQEEFEDLKGRIFRDIETIKSNCRRQPLPRRSATITLSATAAASSVAIQSGWVFDLLGPFQGNLNIPKTIYSATCCSYSVSPPKTKQFSTNTYHKKKKPTPTPPQT